MSSSLRLVLVAAAAVAFASIPACSRGGGTGKPKIAIVTNCTDPFWDLCEAGAKQAAAEHDVELLFRQPEKGTTEVQKPIIDAWVSQGVSGIGVSVIAPDAQTEDLRLVSKQVPLVTMDNDAPNSGRLCYVGVDNREAGKAVGRMIKKALPNGGTLALFIGSTQSANGQARPAGVLEELATPEANGTPGKHPQRPTLDGKFYGKYFLVDGEPKTDDFLKERAVTNARDMINRVDGLADVCFVGLYAYNPPAILEAVKTRSMIGKIKIVGFDENLVTLKAIADGAIEGTVVQDPYNYGYQTVTVLAAVARNDHSKLIKESLPYKVVTRDGQADTAIASAPNEFRPAAEYEKTVRDQFQSVGKPAQ